MCLRKWSTHYVPPLTQRSVTMGQRYDAMGPGVETRQGARRPCDVFVKRCRVGTKETRFSGCPRGSITGGGGGGREVTDKRESYKMGCVTRENRERGCNVREGRWCPSVPVGHPEGAETRGMSVPTPFCSSRGCDRMTSRRAR